MTHKTSQDPAQSRLHCCDLLQGKGTEQNQQREEARGRRNPEELRRNLLRVLSLWTQGHTQSPQQGAVTAHGHEMLSTVVAPYRLGAQGF